MINSTLGADNHYRYDPVKAHDYYEKHKKLKGRFKNVTLKTMKAQPAPAKSHSVHNPRRDAAIARIGRLRTAVSKLGTALGQVEAELSRRRQTARAKAQQNSDGKSTQAQKIAARQERQRHPNAGGSSSPAKKSTSNPLTGMTVPQLNARAMQLRSALSDAKRQLSNANQELGQLAHSDILSEPNVDELFAHFKSVERIPSQ